MYHSPMGNHRGHEDVLLGLPRAHHEDKPGCAKSCSHLCRGSGPCASARPLDSQEERRINRNNVLTLLNNTVPILIIGSYPYYLRIG